MSNTAKCHILIILVLTIRTLLITQIKTVWLNRISKLDTLSISSDLLDSESIIILVDICISDSVSRQTKLVHLLNIKNVKITENEFNYFFSKKLFYLKSDSMYHVLRSVLVFLLFCRSKNIRQFRLWCCFFQRQNTKNVEITDSNLIIFFRKNNFI